MELEDIYENVENLDVKDMRGPQLSSDNQDEGKAQNRSGRWCLVLMAMSLGLICVLLLIFIIRLSITITAEREEHKNTVQEFNHTINSLQTNYTDLRTEKDQLQKSLDSLNQKKLESESRVKDLANEKQQLQQSLDSLNQKKLESESRVKDLTNEKQQLQQRFDSLNQKNLELENKINRLSEQGSGSFFMSNEAKSWSESRQFCRDRGADLIIIKTEEKQRFISSLVKEFVWIGLSDTETEGAMKWVDGSPLTQTFWERNEPNDANGNEDCVELNPRKSVLSNWNDIPCSVMRKSVCER